MLLLFPEGFSVLFMVAAVAFSLRAVVLIIPVASASAAVDVAVVDFAMLS